jgi:hypothetical protein
MIGQREIEGSDWTVPTQGATAAAILGRSDSGFRAPRQQCRLCGLIR